VNGPWNQINLLLSGFNDTNFKLICVPVLQVSAVLLVVACFFYYIQSRRLRNYSVYLDLNEWLLWTSMGTFLLLIMYVVFGFDFIFVLPTMLIGAGLFIWIRFIHFPPLLHAYEERLARQRYFARTKAHVEAPARAKAVAKPKRRRK
jgi:hypothetical protein